jgi:ubiquinone biosynthesis UbiH/UbiF/VisC/COQ6 family hydroxylase
VTDASNFDAIIIGAGPAGLCLAIGLVRYGYRIGLIERQSERAIAEPGFDGREIALTHRSIHILRGLGVWPRIAPHEIAPLKRAAVMTGRSAHHLLFDQRDTKCAALGYLVPNHLIRKAAFEALAAQTGVSFLPDRQLIGLETGADAVTVRTAQGETLRGRWLIVADGRFSETRRGLGIAADMLDFGKSMLVCRMRHRASHAETAREWFKDQSTLALLPLNGTESSAVVTASAAQTQRLQSMDPAGFNRELEGRWEGVLGSMELSSTRHVYPLVATYSRRFADRRCALIGDSAVGMHPVTAHGFNLGLQSGSSLLRELQCASPLLSRYEAIHRRIARPMYLATNAIVRLYTDTRPAAQVLRMAGLHLANRLRPFKKIVLSSLTEFDPSYGADAMHTIPDGLNAYEIKPTVHQPLR